jgi:ATP-binding cassette subfamily B protein
VTRPLGWNGPVQAPALRAVPRRPQALEHSTQRRTTIAIAHRLFTVLGADLILAVEDNRIVEQGIHAELLAHDGLYTWLYTEQSASGKVEARCADGVRFRDGHALLTGATHAA